MLTLDSGSVSLSRSARGDSVQKIWLVGRHSDPFTLENTVFRCVTLPPLGMFPKFWLIPLTRTFWSLRVTLHYLSLLAFVLWSQQGTHKNLFCVNAFLCCSSVSSPMPAIYSCRAICRHFLRLSDCLTSFTLLFLTLPLFLIVHASTLSVILYSAAAAGNLISASSSSSAHDSSDFNSPASDALLVAHLQFLQLLRVHILVLTIRLVLYCGLLSMGGGKTLAINQREISTIQILSFFVSGDLLSLFDAASREHRRTYFFVFTFVFKYSLCKALVKAHAFYDNVSLETHV